MLSLAIDTGRRSASHRFASALNRFSLSGLRRGLAAVLLGLPLLAALASEAAAQTANADGSYTVPQDWALKPSAIGAGESFRLLFISSTTRNATALDTSDYDNHVRNRVAAGHTAIRPYSATFRALYSTTAVDARDHAMTTGTGVPIYWLGGARVADNYTDFHDGSWDSAAGRSENGASQTGTAYTGSSDDGTAFSGRAFSPSGQALATQIRYGSPADGLDSANSESNVSRSYFGLSPIFVVAQTTSVITIAAGTSPVTEGATASFTITATPAPSANLTVSLFVADASGSRDFVASTNEGTQTVTVPTSGSAIYSVPTVADTTSEGSGPVTVTVLNTTAYVVSPSQNSASVQVNDDDGAHVVSLSIDSAMGAEGDSGFSDGATLTFTVDPPGATGFVLLNIVGSFGVANSDYLIATSESPTSAFYFLGRQAINLATFFSSGPSRTLRVRARGDTSDEDDETIQMNLERVGGTPASVVFDPTANRVTYTITDDDPAIVSLTRTGTGAIEEGGTVGFTIALSRALAAGEIIDVPLSIGGTGVTTDDWSLAPATGAGLNPGVTLSAQTTAMPQLRFSGLGAQTATLVLTTTRDGTAEGGGTETYTIALGPNDDSANGFDLASRATNVDDGADPHASDNTFDVMVGDATVHTLSINLDRTMAAEGDSGITDGATVTITIDPSYPTGLSFEICLSGTATRGDSADWRFTQPDNSAPSITDNSATLARCSSGADNVAIITSNLASFQRKIRINGDTVDELDETVTLTLQRSSVTPRDIVLDPDATIVTYTITDDDTAGVIITETDDATTLTEDRGTDEYGVMLATQPTANVTITPTSGMADTAIVSGSLIFTATNWDTVQTITVAGLDNNADAANQQVTITHAINSTGDALYNALAPVSVTATVTDDDATTVTLAGTAGNVMEGAAKAITVTLGRALAEGEALPVPLTFMGEATPGTDYSVTGTAATGVAYTGLDSATGMVTFTGPSATSATLTLSATPDSDVEASGETVIIGLGTLDGDSGTGLDGGASGTDSLDDFSIEDPLLISITGGTAVTEGSSATFTVTANRVPGSALMIDLTVADAAAGDYLDAGDEGDNMVTLSGATTATVEIPTQTDSTDETNGTITVTIADGTGYTVSMSSSAMVGVSDDDATTVTLTGTAGNISEGVTRNLTVTLDRALVAGESLAVPLTLGGNATRGTDYTLTGIPADNIAYDIPNSATAGMVTFTGPAAATATLALAVQVDGTSDTGETITIALGTLDSSSGSGLGGGAAGTGSLAFTIMEQPTIVLPPTLTVTEGASVGYPVSLATAPTANVTVTVTGHTGTDLTLNPDSLEFTATNWNMIQTFTVTAGQDADAVDDTATLTHTATGGNYNTLTAQITVNTRDDEEAGVTISETAITIAEGDEGTYTVVLDSQPASRVEITVTSGLTSAATVNPMILTFTMTNWDTAQTVTVTGVDDNRVNPVREATLSHRISSGGGDYPVADLNQDVTVTVTDNDEAGLSFSGETITLDEGATTNYTVALTTIPTGDVTVTVSGHSGTDLTPDETSLTFTMTDWDTAQTVTVTAAPDGDAANDTVSLTHTASGTTGYSAVTGAVTVTIDDDDTAAITISETAGSTTVLENGSEAGGTDTYTVVLATQPASGVEITVTSGLTSAATVSPLILTFTMTNWDMEQTVTVTGVDDNINNPGDARTATLSHRISSGDSGDYPTGGPPTPAAVTVTVTDDDAAPGVTLSTARITVAEANGMDSYTVVLNTPPSGDVEITASSNLESAATVNPLILTFTTVNWDTEQMVTVTGINDDDTGDREATIGHAITTGDGGNYPVADLNQDVTVTVTDDDATDTQEMQAAQAAWLPRFGLTAVEHMLGGLDYRLSVADQPGLSGNVSGLSAGRALHGAGNGTGTGYAADGFGQSDGGDGLGAGSVDRLLNLSRTLSLRDMLRGSRFVHRGGENGVSVWGQASYSRYEDGQDGVTVDGEVATGLLGVDRDNGRTLLGLALSYSDGDGDWSGTSEQGELSSQLTSLLPYIRHNVTQRLQVWAAASYGRGELEQTLEQTSATMSTKHDIEQRSASAGVRGTLLERPLEEGGLTLTLISDAALARIESDDADGVSGLTSNTKRFRMGLEWSWQLPQADGGRLIPELELGMRYDGGDTSDGLGVELGGGISWQLPSRGLTIDLRGRRLLDHEAAERREWGVSGSLRYDRQPGSAHGPSLSLRQEYGTAPASGGLDRLLSDSLSDALEEDSSQPGPASGRWSLEGEWGLALNDGATGIPYAGLSSSDAGHDLTLGWRLLSAPGTLDTELDIKALRRRDDEGRANHGIGAQWKLHW